MLHTEGDLADVGAGLDILHHNLGGAKDAGALGAAHSTAVAEARARQVDVARVACDGADVAEHIRGDEARLNDDAPDADEQQQHGAHHQHGQPAAVDDEDDVVGPRVLR